MSKRTNITEADVVRGGLYLKRKRNQHTQNIIVSNVDSYRVTWRYEFERFGAQECTMEKFLELVNRRTA